MPRRKYGHMVGACPPTPHEKCRACRLGYPCTVHPQAQKLDYETIRKMNKMRFSGGKKAKRRLKIDRKGRTRKRSKSDLR